MKITKANLMNYLHIDNQKALEILKVLQTPIEEIDQTISGSPYMDLVDWKLDKLNEFLQGYGVEALTSEFAWVDSYYCNIFALYINMGDTYRATIIYDTDKKRFILSSWGDFYESTKYYKKEIRKNG